MHSEREVERNKERERERKRDRYKEKDIKIYRDIEYRIEWERKK